MEKNMLPSSKFPAPTIYYFLCRFPVLPPLIFAAQKRKWKKSLTFGINATRKIKLLEGYKMKAIEEHDIIKVNKKILHVLKASNNGSYLCKNSKGCVIWADYAQNPVFITHSKIYGGL